MDSNLRSRRERRSRWGAHRRSRRSSGRSAPVRRFPWIRTAAQSGVRFAERGSIDVNEYPAVKRWYDEIAARPAVQRGLAILADHQSDRQISDTERENTFGATQFAAR